MTVTRSQPNLSMYAISQGCYGYPGYSLGNMYRNYSSMYGWSPLSGANPISFDDMRGAWYRLEETGYTYYGGRYYGFYYDTQYSCNYSGVYYYYWDISNLTDNRGLYAWYNNGGAGTYVSPYWTVTKMIPSFGHNYQYYYSGFAVPNGAVGEPDGVERLVTTSCTMSVSGCYYYFAHWSTEIFVEQRRYGYWGRYDYSDYNGWYYTYMNQWYYGFGLRKDRGGTLYSGNYYIADISFGSGPTFSSVRYESGITGSRLGGYNRQNKLSVAVATEIGGWYCGATLNLYPWEQDVKNGVSSFDTYTGVRQWRQGGGGDYWAYTDYAF